jgi:hypothetical protein
VRDLPGMNTAPVIPGWTIEGEGGSIPGASVWRVKQQTISNLGGATFGGNGAVGSRNGSLLVADGPGEQPQVPTPHPAGMAVIHASGTVVTPGGKRSWCVVDRWTLTMSARTGPVSDADVQGLLECLARFHAAGFRHGGISAESIVFQQGAWRLLPALRSLSGQFADDVTALVDVMKQASSPAWTPRWNLAGGAGVLALGEAGPATPDIPQISWNAKGMQVRPSTPRMQGWEMSIGLMRAPPVPGSYPTSVILPVLIDRVSVMGGEPISCPTAKPGHWMAVLMVRDDTCAIGPARIIGEARDVTGIEAWFSEGQLNLRWKWPTPTVGAMSFAQVFVAADPHGVDDTVAIHTATRSAMTQQGAILALPVPTQPPWWVGIIHEERLPGQPARRSGGAWIQVLQRGTIRYRMTPTGITFQSDRPDMPAIDVVRGPGRMPTTRADGVAIAHLPAQRAPTAMDGLVQLTVPSHHQGHLRPFAAPDQQVEWVMLLVDS